MVRTWGEAAKWIAAGLLYFALSIWISGLFVRGMSAMARDAGASLGLAMEILLLRSRVFELCVFWGLVYAGALIGRSGVIRYARVWMHLACSYILGMLGSAALIWMLAFPLPNLQSNHVLYGLLSLKAALAIVCFVIAIAAWAYLVFWKLTKKKNAVEAS